MNKGAIQRFAIWARNELIAQVSQRAYQYGITKEGCGEANAVTVSGRALTGDEQKQRKELVDQIRSKGYTQVMEEVAYTWFNRFIALRFMEVNNYLPSHIRVFSDSTGAFKPEILSDVLHLDLPGLNREKVAEYIESNDTEGLYRYLLLTQCNALNDPLPRMFEKMGGYTELLLPNNILKQDSVLGHMVADIPEEDWTDQVQIIGWLYQYYNSDLKAQVDLKVKKGVKVSKTELGAKTQIFTPDWVVRYMTENSLGRLWLDGHPDSELQSEWKYYLDEADQDADVQTLLDKKTEEFRSIRPQDIKVLDPCMGSGHMLVYAFDLLVQIYKKHGISERDAAQSILENNLYGLDIDDRAAQLAYFAVMMKARQYDRRIFSRGIQPHVYSIVESNGLDRTTIDYFTKNDPKLKKDFGSLVEEFRDAKEYGSILTISQVDFAALYARIDEVREEISIFREVVLSSYVPLIQVAEVMSTKYDVVITNPPYMGNGDMNNKLATYIQENYAIGKSDLYSTFMIKCRRMLKPNRYQAMVTMQSWMNLGAFDKLRKSICESEDIMMLWHLDDTLLGIAYQTSAFILRTAKTKGYCGCYDMASKEDYSNNEDMSTLLTKQYIASQDAFLELEGCPIAYALGKRAIEAYTSSVLLSTEMVTREGMTTGNNDRFLRLWHEVDITKRDKKWFPYNKGGEFRKWYGNDEYFVDWENDGLEMRNFKDENTGRVRSHNYNGEYAFTQGITWSAFSSRGATFRYSNEQFLFDSKGSKGFCSEEKLRYILAYLNSSVGAKYLSFFAGAKDKKPGHIIALPFKYDDSKISSVNALAQKCIDISRHDWDMMETSWDFASHPLVVHKNKLIGAAYITVASIMEKNFVELKEAEEEINRIFIEIYQVKGEVSDKVESYDVTISKPNVGDIIRSLISYAVGCMFGRYSLDVDGLAYAGGEWDASKYSTIIPDKDNIIPICDDDYFDDDITGRFVKWVETVYGSETLEENLKFIADALGGKGTPREVIRSYFINDFYADHLKIYQKRPIYWLFDSGKKNGFKALIYIHRYQSDLLARMRTDYVHEQQERYRTQLHHLTDAIEHAGAAERVKLTKQQKKLQEQALEIQKYEEKVHHLADQNIQIDLDDGVKHNYELFADVLAKIK